MRESRFVPFSGYREYPVDDMLRRAREFHAEMSRRRTVRSFSDRPVRERWCAVGEVALSGAVRPVTALAQRVAEAARLGFTDVVVPSAGKAVAAPAGVTLHPVEQLADAVRIALVPRAEAEPDF